jgi:hypothetical protein
MCDEKYHAFHCLMMPARLIPSRSSRLPLPAPPSTRPLPFPALFLPPPFFSRAQQWPEKKSKLTVDINANPASKLTSALEMLSAHQKAHSGEVQKVSIKMPDVDLTKHMPAGKDVVRVCPRRGASVTRVRVEGFPTVGF